MNPASLLLQLLPILVFIVADSIFNNPKLSIILAVVTAAIQMTLFYAKTGQVDWFILLDVGLIVGLGAISIFLNNDIFFKLKPAIVDVLAIAIFIVFIFSPERLLAGYFGRMMQGQFRPEMIPLMKKMLAWMCGYIVLHGLAVLYTAFYSSRKTWAFVAGPGLYFIFIPIMIVVLLKRMQMRRRTFNKPRVIP